MMRYLPFVGGGGGGGGGAFTWYYGIAAVGGSMSSPNDATTAHDDFVTHMGAGVTFEDFEDAGTWEPSFSIEGTTITRNGVVMTFGTATTVTTAEANNGRFSTSDLTTTMLFAEASVFNDGSTENYLSLTFSPAIAAFGCYLTDVGDFSSGDRVYIEAYRTGGGIEDHDLTTAVKANGGLIFIGFTDTTGATYDEVRIRVVQWTGGGAAQSDGFGIDDIYWIEQADIV